MRRVIATFVLLALAIPATAQEWPKPTEAGKTALDGLIRHCIAEGGLKEEKAHETGATTLALGDPAKLKAAVAADRAGLTPALRDALVARCAKSDEGQQGAIVALLRTVGEVTDDERAVAFATFFQAVGEQGRQNGQAAIAFFEEAGRRFQACGEQAWQATCIDAIGTVHYNQADYTRALEGYQKALEIRRVVWGEWHTDVADSYNNIAKANRAQSDYTRALEAHRKALEIRRAVLGERHPKVADSYNSIAVVYEDQGDYARALETHQKALEIRRAVLGERHLDAAQSYNNIANVYSKQGDYARALETHQKALEIRRAALGERHLSVAGSYNNIAIIHGLKGDYAQALEGFQKALEIFRAVSGELHLNVAGSYNNIANVYADQGDYTRALEGYQKALEIRRAALGERHTDVAASYNNIATVYRDQGDYMQALEGYQKALEIYRAVLGEQHPLVAVSYNNIADIYHDQGDYARALEGYQKALEIRRATLGDLHLDVAQSYNGIARVYYSQGDHSRALEGFQKALEILRAVMGERYPGVATSYNNIAVVYEDQGDYARALETHQKALEIRRAVWGERHPDVAQSYSNIANIYRDQGDYPRALAGFQKALEIYRAVLGERHPDVAASFSNIAVIYDDQGDYTQALAAHQKALEIYRAVLGDRHPDVARSYYNIANVYRNQDDYTRALDTIEQALGTLSMAAASPAPPDSAREVSRLRPLPLTVDVLQRSGEIRERILGPDPTAGLRDGLRDYQTAAAVLENVRERVITTAQSKLQQDETAAELFPRIVGVAARLAEAERSPADRLAAFAAAERGAARVFLEDLGRSRAAVVGHVDVRLLEEEARLNARIRQLDGQIDKEQSRPLDKRNPETVRRLLDDQKAKRDDLKALVARMEATYPQYAALMHPKACSIDDARACLAPEEVALLYVLGSEASYLIVVAKEDDPKTAGLVIHTLPSAEKIAELVIALTQANTLEDVESARELGAEAYRVLLAPAAEAIKGKGLVIVPSRALGFLPFELLVEPAEETKDAAEVDGRFLVEGHRLRHAPSMTALHFVRQWDETRQRPERTLWAMGDPVYQTTDERLAARTELAQETRYSAAKYGGGDRGGTFKRLPSTGVEVEGLRRLWDAPAEATLVGPAATEAAVKAASAAGALRPYRYIHFATHGILGLADGTPPSLVLSLAGDQHGEDGFLTLGEVTGLRLNADLVVLSACQTGQGKLYNAEGVSGLARAFLYAGSRAVLCSLWRVDDEATAGLMTDIYAGLKAQKPAADALREAQLRMIADGQSPLYWAPFILIGQ
jgi:tetratricopeptide (TPR) repeat protein